MIKMTKGEIGWGAISLEVRKTEAWELNISRGEAIEISGGTAEQREERTWGGGVGRGFFSFGSGTKKRGYTGL